MFNWLHSNWPGIAGALYPFGHLLWLLCKKLKKLELRNLEFQILKTKEETGLHVVLRWQRPVAELPVQETEKLALLKPKASKRKQAK